MVKFEDLHISKTITPAEFEAGRLSGDDFSPEEISKAVIANVRRLSSDETMSNRQRNGLLRFKYQGSMNIGQPGNYEDIKKFSDIFNDIFFGGLLSGCGLELFRPKLKNKNGYVEAYCLPVRPGSETDPRFKIEHINAIVCMSRISKDPANYLKKGVFGVMQEILNTLLHEQVHAIFLLHECYCGNGCDAQFEYNGQACHTVNYLAVALAVEQEATKLFGWEVDLDRNYAMAQDMQIHGYRLPNDATCRALDLDVKTVLNTLAWYRKHKVAKASEKRERLPAKKNQCMRDTWIVDCWGEKGFQRDEWLLW